MSMIHALVWLFDAGRILWSGMDGFKATPSPQLEAANQRLYALREQARVKRQAAGAPDELLRAAGNGLPWDAGSSRPSDSTASTIATLPGHLGWGSQPLTAVLRRQARESSSGTGEQEVLARLAETAVSASADTANEQHKLSTSRHAKANEAQLPDWVKLYPDIGLGMLREELTAPGRLWLMLRYLDSEGCGVIRIDIIKRNLTKKTSKLRLCGKRQLRNLLQDGEGVYWHRDKEHVWLRSAARVAFALGVDRLTGRPVALPTAALLDGIGTFRAHLYAAFHSGRAKETPHGDQAMPIARETLEQLSGVGRSSQRNYEERIGVDVQANFAVGDLSTKENQEKRAWAKGQALFELKDYRGQQGRKGKTYLAWQLPNSYSGQHRHRPRGRQKRINRKLKDLVMKGMPGNVGGTSETRQPEKIYYPNGKLAAKAYGRDLERELYWKRHKTRNGRFYLWQQLGSV
ncbi:hypothetical protein [Candidatus Leptofilum sp.]|uniref:hypothetical protein n=1 Tax=Candidatus Leptofilum sp. TaxID=3241576 RepID=UPI003B5CAE95